MDYLEGKIEKFEKDQILSLQTKSNLEKNNNSL